MDWNNFKELIEIVCGTWVILFIWYALYCFIF